MIDLKAEIQPVYNYQFEDRPDMINAQRFTFKIVLTLSAARLSSRFVGIGGKAADAVIKALEEAGYEVLDKGVET